MMNPHWIQTILATVQKAVRKCPHCGKRAVYPPKRPGQFHLCKHCRHRFKEKEA
jgi:ssDNA-binding Zn-finger/Zn-ribbon topoisomerase 1